MINYGKVAYNRLSTLELDNSKVKYSFNKKMYTYNLTTTNNYFEINVEANKEVYFEIKCDNKSSFKVYNSDVLQMAKINVTDTIFSLSIQGKTLLKFLFDISENIEVNLKVLGECICDDLSSVKLMSLPNSLAIVKQLKNQFFVYYGNTVDTTLTNYNSDIKTTYNGTFLSLNYINGLVVLYKNNDNIIVAGAINTTLNLNIDRGVIFNYSIDESSFAVAYIINGCLNVDTYNDNGIIINSYHDIMIGYVNNIVSINTVINDVDNNIYFVCTDVNNHNYIVLFKVPNNGLFTRLLDVIEIGVGKVNDARKVTSNNYMISIKNQCLKIIDCGVDYTKKLININEIFKLNNVVNSAVIDDSNVVLNYDGSIIKHNLET